MPAKDAHIVIANKHTQTIDYLLKDPLHSPWVVTVAFYKALHIVEAIFHHDTRFRLDHTYHHEERNDSLRREPRYSKLWKHYKPLYDASRIARYLTLGSGANVYCDFSTYIDASEVKSEFIDHHLFQILKFAKETIGVPGL